jgi:hypothetical protein
MIMHVFIVALLFFASQAFATWPCASGLMPSSESFVDDDGNTQQRLVCVPEPTPTPIPFERVSGWPTAVPTLAPPTPQPTFDYVRPTPPPSPVPTLAPPTPQPTFAYVAPTPQPTPARFTAVYAPASLAANTSRCDNVTVTGIVTSRAVSANPGVSNATGCVIAGVWASSANVVTVCWRNAFAATTACQTSSSTWTFTQP